MSLGSGLVVAVITARTVLPLAVRLMAKHATPELYQLTVVAFCLCSGWLSGYMVRNRRVFTPVGRAVSGGTSNSNSTETTQARSLLQPLARAAPGSSRAPPDKPCGPQCRACRRSWARLWRA